MNQTKDWALLVAWLFYLAFIGPALISAQSWIAVAAGFVIPVVLSYITYKRISVKNEK